MLSVDWYKDEAPGVQSGASLLVGAMVICPIGQIKLFQTQTF
ncbi:hypothetical protein Mic7113_6774 (plasmid) [Allocoleopsis franciscana PCC 7113]|uniref:Uncharacterized protein n=1 Tax=Allocoleopsis franciscana PCC 7113 TaxID=1173027 RepID=K9WPL3_9CYAN|nr:hypothetical protein Mic7113_6774 [Allocoleopsis franciscana PCC 7113]